MKCVSFYFAGIALGCAFGAILIAHLEPPLTAPTVQRDEACQRARTRAAVALYKLRVEATPELQRDGITQTLELAEWMRFCGGDDHVVLTAVLRQPPDLVSVRQQLSAFAQAEAR